MELIGGLTIEKRMRSNRYFQRSIKSEGHTPIYKMHKYFARRPHNIFRALIEHYSPDNGLVVDCFGGGGVTLIEGLTSKRRVISYDVNTIASFIQFAQTLEVSEERIRVLAGLLKAQVSSVFEDMYSTECRQCKVKAHVRWFEHAYKVDCPRCGQETLLDHNSKKIGVSGKPVNGSYNCNNCKMEIKAANVKRKGSHILNLRYRCTSCGSHETVAPTQADICKFSSIIKSEQEFVDRYNLELPDETFPDYWDRQKEDCLSRKGFNKFRDLFTIRNLLCSAMFFSVLESMRSKCTSNEWYFMLMNLSALLRYTNNMTFSVNSWMDGRPVAWAKHAYWTPNQFVECNPMEYFDNRMKAAISGIKDRSSRFSGTLPSFDESDVLSGCATHAIINSSSSKMRISDNSVDVVVTDPPYGSNVQYGELCHFWLVWLKNKLPFPVNLFDLEDEVVVHRKKDSGTNYAKSFSDYKDGLTDIYRECFRVLKPNGVLVFTFNNKNPAAWYAVIRSALNAGFELEPEGVTYQEKIDAYRDTAHLRYDGTMQGDFIYSFVKQPTDYRNVQTNIPFEAAIESCINSALRDFMYSKSSFSDGEVFVAVYKSLLSTLVTYIRNGASESQIVGALDFSRIESSLSISNEFIRNGSKWHRVNSSYIVLNRG